MKFYHHEIAWKDALSDPIVQSVMAADKVDPRELATMFSDIASVLDGRSGQERQGSAFGLQCRAACS